MANGWVLMFVTAMGMGGCATEKAEAPPPQRPAAQPTPEGDSPDRQSAIERVFARKVSELQDCWATEYDKTKNRKLEGNVALQIAIETSGKVGQVKVLQSSFVDPNKAPIEACVLKAVASWSFPEGTQPVPLMRTVHLGAQF